MLEQVSDGVAPNEAHELDTLARILRFTQMVPTVYLPAHNHESAERLAKRRAVPTSAVEPSLQAADV